MEIKTFLSEDGAEIKYVDEGSGKVVLYIYGMGSSLASQENFINVMKQHCRFVVFDQRGFGLTKGTGTIGINQSARDSQALLDYLGIDKAILMGYSMGAAVVFSYVEQFGCDRLEKIIIGDMSPKLINEEGWNLGLYQGQYTREMYEHDLEEIRTDYKRFALILTEQLMYKGTPDQKRDFSGNAEEIRARILAREHNPLIEQALFNGLVDLPEDHQIHNYDYWVTMANADFRDVLKTINIPTAFIYADPGSGYRPEAAEYMHTQVEDSVLLPMKGCSHMAAAENAPQYIKYVCDFCGI